MMARSGEGKLCGGTAGALVRAGRQDRGLLIGVPKEWTVASIPPVAFLLVFDPVATMK